MKTPSRLLAAILTVSLAVNASAQVLEGAVADGARLTAAARGQHVLLAAGANGGMGLNELGAQAARWVAAGLQAGAISPLARQLFGEIGATIGQSAEWVAQNWSVIGPALRHAMLVIQGATAGVDVTVAAGNLLGCAPTVLMAIMAAGLIPPAILQARIQAVEAGGRNDARVWQLDQQAYRDVWRQRTHPGDPLRVPSFRNTADILVEGPSATQVSEQLFQNYINAAFVARANPTDANVARATTLLRLINTVAQEPAPSGNDW